MKDVHKQILQTAHKEKRLVPFIGAGVSNPFKLPTWSDLLENLNEKYADDCDRHSISKYIKNQHYWDAITQIKYSGDVDEMTLQKEICNIIKSKANKSIDPESHNYLDLAKLNSLNYLTTNYDSLLYEFMPTKSPIAHVLHKTSISTQDFFGGREDPRIWHLHGHVDDYGSIVISKEKYDELYNNGKYIDLFKVLQGNGTFLFIGVSFKDTYIQNIIKNNNINFNSQHFIILDSPTYTEKEDLKKCGLVVIEYDSNGGINHAKEIRKILKAIDEIDSSCYARKSSNTNIDSKKPIKVTQIGFEDKIDAEQISNIAFHPFEDNFIYSLDDRIMLKNLNNIFPLPIAEYGQLDTNGNGSGADSTALDYYLKDCKDNIFPDKDSIDLVSLRKYFEKYTCKITNMTYSPCGKYIATSDNNGYLALWNTSTYEIIRHFQAHDDAITSIRFSPNYKFIASASFDETIKIWEIDGLIKNPKPEAKKTLVKASTRKTPGKFPHEIEHITALAFSNSGDFLASGDQKGQLKIRSVFSNAKNDLVYQNRNAHTNAITDIIFSPLGDNIIFTASADSRIRITKKTSIWETITLGRGEDKHKSCVNSISISSDGQILLSSGVESAIKIWNIADESLIQSYDTGHSDSINMVKFCPNQNKFASDCVWESIKLWEISNDGYISNTTVDITKP